MSYRSERSNRRVTFECEPEHRDLIFNLPRGTPSSIFQVFAARLAKAIQDGKLPDLLAKVYYSKSGADIFIDLSALLKEHLSQFLFEEENRQMRVARSGDITLQEFLTWMTKNGKLQADVAQTACAEAKRIRRIGRESS